MPIRLCQKCGLKVLIDESQAGTNPFYQPRIPLEAGILAWFADLVLILILSAHPNTARAGVLVAGLFLAVPCFLWASPLSRTRRRNSEWTSC